MFRKDEILLVYDFLGVILKTKQKKKQIVFGIVNYALKKLFYWE